MSPRDRVPGRAFGPRLSRLEFLERAAVLGLSVGGVSSLLSACGGGDGGSVSPSVSRDSLRVQLDDDISNLDPAFNAGHTNTIVRANIFQHLVGFSPVSWDLVNELAERFQPSEDGLRYEFTLRKGVQFHGGYGEVTAEDVKFSFERIAGLTKPKIDSAYQSDWAALKGVELNDRYSGTIVLNEPFAPLMETTIPGGAGEIVCKKAVEELGDKYGTQPIGTGPYEFVSWKRKQSVLLRTFAKYAAPDDAAAPPWKDLRFTVIPEDNPTAIALETGELDVATVPTSALSRVKGIKGLDVVEKTTLNYTWIGMNTQHPNLQDRNVRLAVVSGIDVPSIIEAAFDGSYTRATALIAPDMPLGYWEDAPVYERDVDKARSFLQVANADGLQLEMSVSEGEPGASTVAEIVQANLQEVGIDVKVLVQDGGVFNQATKEANAKKQLFYTGFTTHPDPSWSTTWFTCDQVGTWNWMGWCNEEYTRLDKQAKRETDEAKRTEMYIRMQQLMDRDAVAVWVAWPRAYVAVIDGLKPAVRPDGTITPWAFAPKA
jgi:peptide/nickel transport system substrate-binding protein